MVTVLAAVVTAGTLAIAGGGRGTSLPDAPAETTRPSATPSPATAGAWHPVSPATTVPARTPVQQRYDEKFAQGYASAASRAMIAKAEALHIPRPAVAGGWPKLATSSTPGGWAREFVHALFDINFAHQSRRALGAWLVAQEAPDLMPGIPASFANRALYVSVMDPQAMRQSSPIPSPAQWRANASAGVRWSLRGLQVQLDPSWQSMIAAGWQPRDLRASVEDVSGVLRSVHGTSSTTRRVSLSVAVGSARWHHGYGTVAVTVRGG